MSRFKLPLLAIGAAVWGVAGGMYYAVYFHNLAELKSTADFVGFVALTIAVVFAVLPKLERKSASGN